MKKFAYSEPASHLVDELRAKLLLKMMMQEEVKEESSSEEESEEEEKIKMVVDPPPEPKIIEEKKQVKPRSFYKFDSKKCQCTKKYNCFMHLSNASLKTIKSTKKTEDITRAADLLGMPRQTSSFVAA